MGVDFECSSFIIEILPTPPTGNIIVKTLTGQFMAVPGREYHFTFPQKIRTVIDDTSETLRITYGFGIQIPVGGTNGGFVPQPLIVEGPQPPLVNLPLGSFDNPLVNGMLRDN